VGVIMILYFVQNTKKDSPNLNKIGKVIDSESEEYYDVEYLNGIIETLCRSEHEYKTTNIVDVNNKQCWNELLDDEVKFIAREV
jgi:hypothetical protein